MRSIVYVTQGKMGGPAFGSKIALVLLGCFTCFCITVKAGVKPGGDIKVAHRGTANAVSNRKTHKKNTLFTSPTLSYPTPPVYLAGKAITPLVPTSSGIAPISFKPTPNIIGSGFSLPYGLAEDGQGEIFITEPGNNQVKKIPRGSNVPVVLASGFNNPTGIAVLSSNHNVYIADNNNNAIKELVGGTGTPATIGSGFLHPSGVAVDSLGNVYVADSGNGLVKKIPAGGGAIVVLGSGFVTPVGVAVDAAGNVFVADQGNSTVKKIPVGGGSPVSVGSGFNNPTAVAVDYSGNLFVSDSGNNEVKMYVGATGSAIIAASGLNGPAGIFASVGGVLVADQLNNTVDNFHAWGGYYIDPSLPPGLSFSSLTGVISGTPTKISAAKTYTASGADSGNNAVLQIVIEVDALAINYPSPQVLTSFVSTTISPTSTGVAAPGYNNAYVTKTNGFNNPNGVAVDKQGNIYVADHDAAAVREIPANGGAVITLGSGFIQPIGVAVDDAGNVFVADAGWHSLREIPVNNGTVQSVGSGYTEPIAVTIDARTGFIYLLDAGSNALYVINPISHLSSSFITGLSLPHGVAVTSTAIFIVNGGTGSVKKYNLNGVYQSDVVTSTDFEFGIASDQFGNIFIADTQAGAIKELPSGQTALTTIGSGLTSPQCVAVDGAGIVYVTDPGTNLLKKIAPSGGYFINPAPPAGLTMSNTTGVISGLTQAPMPATDYTITAYNSYGSNSAILNITINPLTISYASPQTYTAGTAIAPLAATSAGVGTTLYLNGSNILSTNTSGGALIAIDAAGNIYIPIISGNEVIEVKAAGGVVQIGSGFVNPSAVAVSTTGDIYVADAGNNAIKKIPSGQSTAVVFASGFNNVTSVAVDAQGNVYASDLGADQVYKFPADGTSHIILGSDIVTPNAVAADAAGNVYIADTGDNTLKMVPAGGIADVILATGFQQPVQVTTDPGGDVYVIDYNKKDIEELQAGQTSLRICATGLNPGGIAVDGAGNLYYNQQSNGQLSVFAPTGGYYVNKALPAGLKFNGFTGTISGTPSGLSAATNYTISAYNPYCSNSAAITIKVNLPAPPAIAYASPQIFTANTNSVLTPTASRVAAPAYSTNAVSIGSGFAFPADVALDAAGNIYVVDASSSSLKKMPPGGGAPTVVSSAFSAVSGVAVDAAGNIYVANGSIVTKIPVGGGATSSVGSGFNSPGKMAFDAAGNLYVADGVVKEVLAGTNITINLGNVTYSVNGLAVNAAGDVYYTNPDDNYVELIPANRGGRILISTDFDSPYALALDAAGDLFISDIATNAVKEIYAGSNTAHLIGPGGLSSYGMAVDPAGNLYTADLTHNAVRLTKPVGGYYINKPLPAGLNINNTSGLIFGRSAITSPATDYSVVAYNLGGSSTSTVNIQINAPPAPSVSYSGIGTYYKGLAITPPTATISNNIGSPGYSGSSAVVLGSGFVAPNGIARDTAGNVYVIDGANHTIYKIPAGSNTRVAVTSALTNPIGLAVDAAGTLYIVNQGHGVYKMIAGGTPTAVGTGLTGVLGVAVDAAGNLYVTDATNNAVKKIAAAGSTITTIATGFNLPAGIAIDVAGNIFVADRGNKLVKEIPAGTTTPIPIGTGFNNPYGVAADALGNVFVGDEGSNSVKEIFVRGNSTTTIGSGFVVPGQVAVDSIGNVYFTDNEGASGVKKLAPTGGFYVNPALPAGISLSTSVGSITGTPTVTKPATNYTVTVYNIGGSGKTTLNFAVTAPPLPTLSYTTPQSYVLNTAITPLSPTKTNVAAPAYTANPTAVGTGISVPGGVASDGAGNIFVADNALGKVWEIPVGGGPTVAISSGFNGPFGIAVDVSGNIYVADQGNNAIKKIPLVSGTYGAPVAIGSGFSGPYGVAVDAAKNVYVADTGNGLVKKIPWSGSSYGTPVAISNGFFVPYDVALDAAGNLYIADGGDNSVKEVPFGSSTQTILASGFSSPSSVKVDASGNLFIADFGNNAIKKIPVGSSTPVAIGSGFNGPTGVCVDPFGNVYAADYFNDLVKKINPTGGYYLSSALPAGLSLSNSTGVISGTPTKLAAAKNYTVSAYNASGRKSVFVNITVSSGSNNANLSALAINAGTLTPVFASATTSYTASVANAVSTLTIAPTTADNGATVKVNGTTVSSGSPSGALALSVGANTITTVVTAQDGTTTKTYTVTVTRVASANASLASMSPSVTPLSPAFAPGTTSYTLSVSNAVATMTVKPVTSDANATLKVNGAVLVSGTVSPPISLAEGTTTPINVVVTAQDGTTTKTYTITVNRAPSADASLANIALSTGTLSPVFASGTVTYTASVPNSTSTITLAPTSTDANATIKVNGTSVTSGTASGPIALNVGPNTITTVVTAQNVKTLKTYTVTVTRVASANANLASINPSATPLSPAFAQATTSYTLGVPNATASMTVKPVTSDANATIKVNGTSLASGTVSQPIALAVGSNTVNIVVTAPNGTTTKTYTIAVTRAAGPIANFDDAISVNKPTETSTMAEDGILVHQGISPNGDGVNDFLAIDNINRYPDNKLIIMNRNGQLVYEANGYDNSAKVFDGHSNKNGRMQLPGTYFYQLDYTVGGITKHKTGFIVLKY